MVETTETITEDIREQDPLKQGLKHSFNNLADVLGRIREQDPLKQGLKQLKMGAGALMDLFASKIH